MFVPFVALAACLVAAVLLLRRKRRRAAVERAEADAVLLRRKLVRARVVEEAAKLVDLEAEADDPRPDTDPDIKDKTHAWRQRLEADCRKAGLPLGLVRRRKSDFTPPRLSLPKTARP